MYLVIWDTALVMSFVFGEEEVLLLRGCNCGG